MVIVVSIFYYSEKKSLIEVCIVIITPNSNLLIFRNKVHAIWSGGIMPADWQSTGLLWSTGEVTWL